MSLGKEVEEMIEEIRVDHLRPGVIPAWSNGAARGAREMAEWLMEKVCEVCGGQHDQRAWPAACMSLGPEITRAEFLSRKNATERGER